MHADAESLRPSSRTIELPHLSVVDRFLPLWIVLAMVLGIVLGRARPGLGTTVNRVGVAGVSLPIAIGLLWMMYPVLAKVNYGRIGELKTERRLFGLSLVLNWVVGPIVMFVVAWAFLADEPAYRNGVILIGLARCIAMVLIWNMLANGDSEVAAVLVALNSVFQILMYSVLGWLLLSVVPGWLGQQATAVDISMGTIAKNVAIFLGLPLAAGALTRALVVPRKGADWYDRVLMPRLGPTALVGLLYTIVLMFAMQGERIVSEPGDVFRIALPLVVYFVVMFSVAFVASQRIGLTYPQTAAVSFTAAGNNFELAIAVSVATFGLASGEALAGVVGPLIEVPMLLLLVYLSRWLRDRLFPNQAVADVASLGGEHRR